MTNDDQWIDVEGYEGLYKIARDGRIWSVKRFRRVESGLLVTCTNGGTGYIMAMLQNKGRKTYSLHRLVAKAFIPNPLNLPQVNHINGDKTDNRVENLEWCSAKDNIKHAIQMGLRNQTGENNAMTKITSEDVADIRLFASKGLRFAHIAKVYPVSSQTISNIVKGKTWKNI